MLCDIPEFGIVGPRRFRDRLVAISIIVLSPIIPLFVLYMLGGFARGGDLHH